MRLSLTKVIQGGASIDAPPFFCLYVYIEVVVLYAAYHSDVFVAMWRYLVTQECVASLFCATSLFGGLYQSALHSIVISASVIGCVNVMASAWRNIRLALAVDDLPYSRSPNMGAFSPDLWAQCTLSWCVLPVRGNR